MASDMSGPLFVNTSDLATLVKQSVDIIDVIGQVVPLRRAGSRHVGLCPFHQEKTPSFTVDSNNQLYHCFGCGIGGDVLTFVMKHQNLPFNDAIRHLADRYHIALPERDPGLGASAGVMEAARREKEELYAVLHASGEFFRGQLHHSESGRTAREYLAERGLPPQVVEEERMGYAPAEWDSLVRHFRKSGTDLELGIKAGLLAKSSRDASRFYDRFRNRLIFPIKDDRGRIVGFGGRILAADARDEPKYLNSPETLVYQKGRMLYQLFRAREACRDVRQVVLVEGYMDLLAFHAQGFYRVVATLGTALTAQQVRLLKRVADEVILAYDGDEAGDKAMVRSLPLFHQEEMPVSCVRFPRGMDPDDFLGREGLAGFERLVQKRQDLGTFAMRKVLDAWDGSVSGKGGVIAELKPLFEAVRQPVLRAEYLRLVSDRLSLSEETIERQLEHGSKRSFRGSPGRPHAPAAKLEGSPSLEESIVRLMIKYPELIEAVDSSSALDCFRELRLKTIAETLIESLCETPTGVGPRTAYDSLPDEETKGLYTRLLLDAGEIHEPRIQMEDWLEALLGRKTRWECSDLQEALRQAEHAGDVQEVKCLLARIQELGSMRKKGRAASENN
jgi:DNA primase